ncbi:MAG: methylmalonyl-CoA mutase [Chloroflexota bacterium]|nr:MAG: methylmalonyl-CoA mutase [Chloroflexota bacterium]
MADCQGGTTSLSSIGKCATSSCSCHGLETPALRQAQEDLFMDNPSEGQAREWKEQYRLTTKEQPEHRRQRRNLSGIPLKPLYLPSDVRPSYDDALGFPGQYPFTRGVYPSMYRGQQWSRRMLVGHEAPETWNARMRRMFAAGQTAASMVPCNVIVRGFDVDEVDKHLVGTCGTPVCTIRDIEICYEGMPIDRLSVAFQDMAPFTAVAMYLAMAKRRGVPVSSLRGTTAQSDFISHFIACHLAFRIALEGQPRLLVDHVKYCTQHMPHWNPVSILGQNLQQAGATPLQELAFTLSVGIFYVDLLTKAGLPVDSFAPRFTFFFDVTSSLFEEVAKFRAARRIWAKVLKERFGAKDPRSLRMKFHAQTSGRELIREQAMNNVTRVSMQALGAVLGGCQSLHTDCWDEPFGAPAEEAARLALMTQNVIAEETGVADVIDPLGGSYYVEALTDEMEQRAWGYIERIDAMGGMLEATKRGFPHAEIARSSLEYQRAIDRGERVLVGLNAYQVPEDIDGRFTIERPDLALVESQIERTKAVRRERNAARAQAAIDGLHRAFDDPQTNTFEAVLNAVEADLTHGEIVRIFRERLGEGRTLTGIL